MIIWSYTAISGDNWMSTQGNSSLNLNFNFVPNNVITLHDIFNFVPINVTTTLHYKFIFVPCYVTTLHDKGNFVPNDVVTLHNRFIPWTVVIFIHSQRQREAPSEAKPWVSVVVSSVHEISLKISTKHKVKCEILSRLICLCVLHNAHWVEWLWNRCVEVQIIVKYKMWREWNV